MPLASHLETPRLVLRRLTLDDAPFVLGLVNQPAWLQFIGDKGIRTLADARDYIRNGPLDTYSRLGFGLYLVGLKEGGIPIGLCGLLKRPALEDVDIGFAFLPEHWGHGYAVEAARAVLSHGRGVCGLQRIVAITMPENQRSIRVIETLGLRFERSVRLSEDGEDLCLYS